MREQNRQGASVLFSVTLVFRLVPLFGALFQISSSISELLSWVISRGNRGGATLDARRFSNADVTLYSKVKSSKFQNTASGCPLTTAGVCGAENKHGTRWRQCTG